MNKKKQILALVLVLAFMGIASAEILVQTAGGQSQQAAIQASSLQEAHTFLVNTYALPAQPQQQAAVGQKGQEISIRIEPIISQKTITSCLPANYSFKITNIGKASQIYEFSIKDFKGTAFITQNLMLSPKESRLVGVSLLPDCSEPGEYNPRIHVITRDSTEEAYIPVILRVNTQKEAYDPNACERFYNQSICASDSYLRFNKGEKYTLDLSGMFYDPDGDKLEYSHKSINLNIKIEGSKATISAKGGWAGAEQIMFYASDGKGGSASSKRFYVHVIDSGRSQGFFQNLLAWLFE